jgi:hypothetical protein
MGVGVHGHEGRLCSWCSFVNGSDGTSWAREGVWVYVWRDYGGTGSRTAQQAVRGVCQLVCVAGRAFSSTEMKLSERRALENAACQWVSDNGCLRDAI